MLHVIMNGTKHFIHVVITTSNSLKSFSVSNISFHVPIIGKPCQTFYFLLLYHFKKPTVILVVMESHLSSSNLATASNGGLSSDPSKESGKVWERPWSITELREGSKNWTLASDAGVSPPFCLHIRVHVHVHCIRTCDILLGLSQYEQFIKCFYSQLHPY